MNDFEFQIPEDWLKREVGVFAVLVETNDKLGSFFNRYEYCECETSLQDEIWTAEHMTKCWTRTYEFVNKMTDKSKVWFFRSPQETWDNLCGSEGYCIVDENRNTIASRVTTLN